MSGIAGFSSRRGSAVGALARPVTRARHAVARYLQSVRRRGGLPVTHAVPVAVAVTVVLGWVLITAASAARPV
jgi:hypothetical protein